MRLPVFLVPSCLWIALAACAPGSIPDSPAGSAQSPLEARALDPIQESPAPGTQPSAPGDDRTLSGAACPAAGCPEGTFCQTPEGACGDLAAGRCEPMPQLCTMIYAPICGCDGQTWASDCVAAAAGVPVQRRGDCEGDGTAMVLPDTRCTGDAECETGLRCDRTHVQGCNAAAAGLCEPVPSGMCTREYMPVCGCDGETYPNDCQRRVANVPLAHRGPCGAP